MNSRPLHVGGFPSGGTDLTRNFLNGHPDVAIAGEFPFLPRVLDAVEADVPAERLADVIDALYECDSYGNFGERTVDAAGFEAKPSYTFAEIYRRVLTSGGADPAGLRPHALWFGNKTPQNTEYLDDLNRTMPDGRFILVVRDVRDVAMSWRNKWGRDLVGCAHRWSTRMKAGVEKVRALGERGRIVRFESLLAEPQTEAERLAEFLSLPDAAPFVDFAARQGVKSDGKRFFGEAIVRTNKEKWRKDFAAREIRRIEEVAYDTMEMLGYAPEFAAQSTPVSDLAIKRADAADLVAMITVGNRYKTDNSMRTRMRDLAVTLRRRAATAN